MAAPARPPAAILSPGGPGQPYPAQQYVPAPGQPGALTGDAAHLATALGAFLRTKLGRACLDLTLFGLVCLILQVVNSLQDYVLSKNLGIKPREPGGFVGVFFCHILHWGWRHLTANMAAFFWCAAVVYIDIGFHRREFGVLSLFIALVTGVLTWLISRTNSCTVGASGLIFGYMLWILSTVLFHFQWRRLILAVLTFLVWGSALVGILPTGDTRVSWQGHLSGAIAGVLAAWMPIFAHRHCPGALHYLGLPVKDPREPQSSDSLFGPPAAAGPPAAPVFAAPAPVAPPAPNKNPFRGLFGGGKRAATAHQPLP